MSEPIHIRPGSVLSACRLINPAALVPTISHTHPGASYGRHTVKTHHGTGRARRRESALLPDIRRFTRAAELALIHGLALPHTEEPGMFTWLRLECPGLFRECRGVTEGGKYMRNFTFYNPTRIIFGKGRIRVLSREIPQGTKILVTYGGGSVRRTGVLDQVFKALAGREVLEFGGIEPNPEFETLMEGVTLARREGVDFLLAVGGGSVIDGTKFMAAAIPFEGDAWEITASGGSRVDRPVPLGTVLTLPATGSEMNSGAVISRRSIGAKLPFSHPSLFPRFSVLDPTTTFTLPPRQVANGIVDTFVHVMEQYLTYPSGGRVQDRLAEGLLLTLLDDGPRALVDPENYEVRANLMWCASLGLNGLIGAGVPQDWATHMVGHELTALYGLDHGVTLAVVLPAMLQVRRMDKRDKLLQYAGRVWGITRGDGEQRIDAAIARTRAFFEELGIPATLGACGVGGECIEKVAEQLVRHGMGRLGERSEVTPEIVRKVLELCL